MLTIISCTNRKNALTKAISIYYSQLLLKQKIKSQILDLSELPEDFAYSALYENAGKNPNFNTLQEIIDKEKKIVFIVPEYNGSFPGVLKTFIDGLRYPDSFTDKKAALVGISSGIQGGALALSHLNDILSFLGMDVLGFRVRLPFIEKHFKNNQITDNLYNQLLEQQIQKLIAF